MLGRFKDLCAALARQGIPDNELDDETFRALALLVWQSPYLTQMCLADASALACLVREHCLYRARSLREYERLLAPTLEETPERFDTVLRVLHGRELLRIAWRHVCDIADIDHLMQELSDLADSTVRVVTDHAHQDVVRQFGVPRTEADREASFTVLAMGKLGGEELNFSSDIDLMFVYRGDGDTTGGESDGTDNRVFFERVATAICDHLSRPTAEGFLYRVDTRLRPQGTKGALVPSLGAVETYYHNWGENWERQALLKLRPIAGDPALGEAIQRILTPFTYRKYVDEVEIAETLRGMDAIRRRMVHGLTREEQESDVKVGRGGIRDVEFIVQAVQMLYSGQYPEVRLAGTLESLRRMYESGLLHSNDYEALSSGYRFLRRVEHRLQIDQVRQTYRLPHSEKACEDLALRLGFESYAAFEEIYRNVRANVRRIYEGIFGRQEWEDQAEGLLDGGPISPAHRQLLIEHGFDAPDRAYRNLLSLADNPSTPHLKAKTRRLFKALLPRLLLYLKDSPDPDMALNSLEQIVNRLGARTTLYGIMAESPQLVEMLVILTSGSRYLSEILFRDPSLVETLGREDTLQRPLDRSTFKARLELIREADRDERDVHGSLIRFKNALELETGLRYLLGISDVQTLGADLAAAGEFILQEVVLRTAEAIRDRYPRFFETSSEKFGVVALGKLGGQELNFASDLDLIFLHEECDVPEEILPVEFFSRWAAKISAFLSEATPFGRLYECDSRLRPHGKSGALSTGLPAFDRYVRNNAQVWERMALTRCRPVAAGEEWQRRFNQVWRDTLFSRPFTESDCEEVVKMRFRIEREKSDEALKAGPGGLVDVEFIAQTLVLRYGREYEALCGRSTPDVLAAAKDLGLLPSESSLQLRRSYLFLRDIENRLQIVNRLSIDSLPEDKTELERLAKRCFPQRSHPGLSGQYLVQEVESHTSRIREIFRQFFNV